MSVADSGRVTLKEVILSLFDFSEKNETYLGLCAFFNR